MIAEVRVQMLLVLLSVYWLTRTNCAPFNITENENKGVKKYLEDSWGVVWFFCLDINRDQRLSLKDAEMCRDRLIEANDLEPEDRERIEDEINYWWSNFILNGNETNQLSSIEFVDTLTRLYLEDELKFRREAVVFQCIVHDASDIDENGKLNESIDLYKAFGVYDEPTFEGLFNAFNPEQGEVPKHNMSMAWADFVTYVNGTNNFIREYFIETFDLDV